MATGLIDAFFGLFQLVVNGVPFHFNDAKKSERKNAEEQLRTYCIKSANETYVLDGSNAKTLREEESFTSHNGEVHDYVLTRFLVTPQDRYFLLKSNPRGQPFVKELAPSRAKLVLKGGFRLFADSDA